MPMLAVLAAVVFAVGWICVALVHGNVAAGIVPGFLYLGGCLLALHLVWPYTPWHRPPP
jgi:hypothetical protein